MFLPRRIYDSVAALLTTAEPHYERVSEIPFSDVVNNEAFTAVAEAKVNDYSCSWLHTITALELVFPPSRLLSLRLASWQVLPMFGLAPTSQG